MVEKSMIRKERVCVYDIVLNGEVVYVGMTKQPKVRYYQHKITGVCSEGAKLVIHKWYNYREDASVAELERQQELRPPLCKDLVIRERPKLPKRPEFDWEAYRAKLEEFNKMYTVEEIEQYWESRHDWRKESAEL